MREGSKEVDPLVTLASLSTITHGALLWVVFRYQPVECRAGGIQGGEQEVASQYKNPQRREREVEGVVSCMLHHEGPLWISLGLGPLYLVDL